MGTTQALREMLFALVAGDYFTDGLQIHLYKEPVVLSSGMTEADFTEANYTGYAVVTADLAGTAWDDVAGNAVLSFEGVHFQPSGSAVGNTIYGWYATMDAIDATEIVRAVEFPAPISMLSVADAIDVSPRIGLGLPTEPIGA